MSKNYIAKLIKQQILM